MTVDRHSDRAGSPQFLSGAPPLRPRLKTKNLSMKTNPDPNPGRATPFRWSGPTALCRPQNKKLLLAGPVKG